MALQEETIKFVKRNPIVRLIDRTEEKGVSRSKHLQTVIDLMEEVEHGQILVVAQRGAGSSLWLTEWSCALVNKKKHAFYRRGSKGRTEEKALTLISSNPSYCRTAVPNTFPTKWKMLNEPIAKEKK